MLDLLSLSHTMDALVPITRFNTGEANKIFEEVREAGGKVVVDDDAPVCMLLAPEKYQEIVDAVAGKTYDVLAEELERFYFHGWWYGREYLP